MDRKVIAIGAFGDDCHNVGLTIFKMMLEEMGYGAVNIGIAVKLEDVQKIAPHVDGVVLTSVNGHGFDYLSSDASLEKFHGIRQMCPNIPIIVGGNLHPTKNKEQMREFLLAQGFSEAIADTRTSLEKSMQIIDRCLRSSPENPVPFSEKMEKLMNITKEMLENPKYPEMEVSDAVVPDALLEVEVKRVGEQWNATAGICFRDMLDAQAMLPKKCRFSLLPSQEGKPLVQPRCGVASPQEQEELLAKVAEAGASAVPLQIDSNTRNGEFAVNERLLREGATLNGTPIINWGREKTCEIVARMAERYGISVQIRHGSKPEVSLQLAALGFASGVSGFEGGAGTYLLPYFKDIPVSYSIHYWQCVDRLCGKLTEAGYPIDREFFGVLTGTLVPPEIGVSVNIVEALLAARQGVKSLSLGICEGGNRHQDVAALQALRSLTHEYLAMFGYRDVRISTVMSTYMAAFPRDAELAEELIRESGATACLGGADRVIVKTPVEAFRTPTGEDNISGMRLTKMGIKDALTGAAVLDEERLKFEGMLIEKSVRAIMDAVLSAGEGDVAKGFVKAVKEGIIDVPFSPNRQIRGELVAVRDLTGAVRIARAGKVPVPADVFGMHAALVGERMKERSERELSQTLYRDVTFIPEGKYAKWPLSGESAMLRGLMMEMKGKAGKLEEPQPLSEPVGKARERSKSAVMI